MVERVSMVLAAALSLAGCQSHGKPSQADQDSPAPEPAAAPEPPAPAPTLEPQWAISFGTPWLDSADRLAVDARGVTYLSFRLNANGWLPEYEKSDRRALAVAAFDPAGVELWRQEDFDISPTAYTHSLVAGADGAIELVIGGLGTFEIGERKTKQGAWVRLSAADGSIERVVELGDINTASPALGELFVAKSHYDPKAFEITRMGADGEARWTSSLPIDTNASGFFGMTHQLTVADGAVWASGSIEGQLMLEGEAPVGEFFEDCAWIARLDADTGALAWAKVPLIGDGIGMPRLSPHASGDVLAITKLPRNPGVELSDGRAPVSRTADDDYMLERFDAKGESRWRRMLPGAVPELLGLMNLRAAALGQRTVLLGQAAAKLGNGDIYLGWLDEQGQVLRRDLFGSPQLEVVDGLVVSGERLIIAGGFAGPLHIGSTTLEPVPLPEYGTGDTRMSLFVASFALR